MSFEEQHEHSPELRAGEYVLGTLRGADREAFELLLRDSLRLQQAVADWEQRLSGLNAAYRPVSPPPQTWSAVTRRLGFEAGNEASKGFWRGFALLATAASLIMATLLVRQVFVEKPALLAPMETAVVRADDETPIWMVVFDWRERTWAAQPVMAKAAATDKDYELWLLGPEDAAPISFGLLSAAAPVQRSLPVQADRTHARAIAVSLEPKGGSPSGAPTGPVLYVAPLPESAAI